jgi:hypothetical protein
MWEPRRLTTLWASTACYRDSFTFTTLSPWEGLPDTHRMGDLEDARSCLNAVGKTPAENRAPTPRLSILEPNHYNE